MTQKFTIFNAAFHFKQAHEEKLVISEHIRRACCENSSINLLWKP